MIIYPLTAHKDKGAKYSHLKDSSGRVIAGCLLAEDAEELVERLNATPKRKSKRELQAEALRRSDLSAQLAGRDNIEYAPHDSLPSGMHVANLRREP